MHGLIRDHWRVVATRTREADGLHAAVWNWKSGFSSDALHRAERADDIIMMTSGAEIWARIAGPNWKKRRREMKTGQFRWGPKVRKA